MEKLFSKYFAKHQVYNADELIESDIKVVIPVYLEEDDLFDTLESICLASNQSEAIVEVVLVFNYSDKATKEVVSRQHALMSLVHEKQTQYETSRLTISVIEDFNIPAKHAGVGHARKTGMNYAALAFASNDRGKGIIVSCDADTLVDDSYFVAINDAFKDKDINGCTLYFEHPLNGLLNDEVYEAIAEYELHLRYYVQALRFAGFPHAYHTVGSCFAVTANAYVRAGGMPRKQAGEDFYFLQKVIALGRFQEINATTVHPSSRPSERVPFGTGPSIISLINEGGEYQTYNLQAFIDLKEFLQIKDELYRLEDNKVDDIMHKLSGRMRSYLMNSDFFKALKPINDNCSTLEVFQKRFYEVFNAFRVVKYLNYVHAHFLDKMDVFTAASNLYQQLDSTPLDVFDSKELLLQYRKIEKE